MVLKEFYVEPPSEPEQPDIPPEILQKIQKKMEKMTGKTGKLKVMKLGGGGNPKDDPPELHDKEKAMEVFNRAFGYIISDARHVIQSKPNSKELQLSLGGIYI